LIYRGAVVEILEGFEDILERNESFIICTGKNKPSWFPQ